MDNSSFRSMLMRIKQEKTTTTNKKKYGNRTMDDLLKHPSSIEDMIKMVPDYYPLDCNHTIVYLKNMREIVIPNLRHCFRTLSIQVIMDDSADGDGVGIGASLITKEFIDMRMNFWKMQKQQQDETNYEDTRIYLELQRRQGDSILFHHYAKKILKAATATNFLENLDCTSSEHDGNAAISTEERRRSNIPTSSVAKITTTNFFLPPLIKRIDTDLQNVNYTSSKLSTQSLKIRTTITETKVAATTIIQRTICLLKSKKFDSQMLGMESLCILTDPNKTNRSIVYSISRDIIFGNNSNNDSSFLHTRIFKLILLLQQEFPKEEETQHLLENRDVDDEYDRDYRFYDKDNDDDEIRKFLPGSFDYSQRKYYRAIAILRNYALTILSNAWEVIIHYFCQNNVECSNINDDIEESKAELASEGGEGEEVTTMYPEFSSAVILIATNIINRNGNRMRLQQQQQREIKEYHSDDNSISNGSIITLIIQSLWKDIAFANYQPHNACLAIKCLLCLFRCCYHNGYDNDNITLLSSAKERCILKRAEMIGKATNQRLETLSQELLRQIA